MYKGYRHLYPAPCGGGCLRFARTIGAVIYMKEGNIKFQFPLRKGMEHFPRTIIKPPYESIMSESYVSRTKNDNT